jgi:acetyl-CoA C-acetyltransferase
MLRDGLNDAFSDEHSGWHTEDLAEKFRIGREAQDEWALRSQQRFSTAQAAGKFKEEIVPLELPGRKGATIFDKGEHNRPQTTLEALAVNSILTALLSAESPVRSAHFNRGGGA